MEMEIMTVMVMEADGEASVPFARVACVFWLLLLLLLLLQKVLFCSTDVGRAHMARQLDTRVHFDSTSAAAMRRTMTGGGAERRAATLFRGTSGVVGSEQVMTMLGPHVTDF